MRKKLALATSLCLAAFLPGAAPAAVMQITVVGKLNDMSGLLSMNNGEEYSEHYTSYEGSAAAMVFTFDTNKTGSVHTSSATSASLSGSYAGSPGSAALFLNGREYELAGSYGSAWEKIDNIYNGGNTSMRLTTEQTSRTAGNTGVVSDAHFVVSGLNYSSLNFEEEFQRDFVETCCAAWTDGVSADWGHGYGSIYDQITVSFNMDTVFVRVTNGEFPDRLAPLMPSSASTSGGFLFDDVDVLPGLPVFIDPDVATGYDYSVNGGALITAASFGAVTGDADGYDVYALDDLSTLLGHVGEENGYALSFASAVSGFSLRGIDPAAGLDPLDQGAFVTGLTFDRAGTVDITQTAVLDAPLPPSGVPEPASWALLLVGFGAVGSTMRARQGPALARVDQGE